MVSSPLESCSTGGKEPGGASSVAMLSKAWDLGFR